jgi:hypothetical protein
MLIKEYRRVDTGTMVHVNLEHVSFAGDYVRKDKNKTITNKTTCVLAMSNGAILHVEASLQSVVTAMSHSSRK